MIVAPTRAAATTLWGLCQYLGMNCCRYTACWNPGNRWNRVMFCGGAPGFNTWSKIGPIRRTRKASSSPTTAISKTERKNCNQYGRMYFSNLISCGMNHPCPLEASASILMEQSEMGDCLAEY